MTRCCIVIVTHNSMGYLEGLCASLKKFVDFSKDSVVFVDNASTDGTAAFLESAFKGEQRVRVIKNSGNNGFAQANNLAMREDESDLYLLLNHDTYLLNDIVSDMLSFYSDPSEIGIAGPALVYPDFTYQSSAYPFSSPFKLILQELGLKRAVGSLRKLPAGERILKGLALIPVCRPYIKGLLNSADKDRARAREEVDWVTGACMLISRRVFKATGGFDEKIFMYGEDEELCFRARKSGFRVDRVGAGPVVHYFGWHANREKESMSPRIYDSLSYVIDKNFSERPLSRFVMKKILDRRFRKSAHREAI